MVVPSPSWPNWLDPQQYMVPPETIPQVCKKPGTMLEKFNPPNTVTGEVRLVVVPSPSAP